MQLLVILLLLSGGFITNHMMDLITDVTEVVSFSFNENISYLPTLPLGV